MDFGIISLYSISLHESIHTVDIPLLEQSSKSSCITKWNFLLGIMIFSSKSDADFSLSGSDEQHTFHDERDVEHITNEVAIMKTTNNNTQHIIQSSNSRHHGTDVTNDNGELRDDDEVFIRAESAPHVSSVMIAVQTGL